jgi:hypothetical protein
MAEAGWLYLLPIAVAHWNLSLIWPFWASKQKPVLHLCSGLELWIMAVSNTFTEEGHMALTEQDLAQINRLIGEQTKELHDEINRVDDWANGVYAALLDVVSVYIQSDHSAAQALAERWQATAQDFDKVEAGEELEEPQALEFLEARKMLYRTLQAAGQFPHDEG